VTGEGQISVVVGPAVLTGDDVLDMVRKGAVVLRKEAVFTAVPGSGTDQYPGCRFHLYRAS
jgi:hypothetical protein